MPSLDPAVAGYDKSWLIGPLVDDDGNPVDYDPGSVVDVVAIRHDGSASPAMTAAWEDPDDPARIILGVTGNALATAGPGSYRVRVGATAGGVRSLAFDGTLEVLAPSANAARLSLESAIFGQFGPNLKLVGVEHVPGAETRPFDLPLARALADMGLPPASFSAVDDDDLAAIPAYARGQFHDLLNVRALELILDRWDGFDFTAGSENAQKLGDLRKSIEATLARKEKANAALYTRGAIVADPGSTPPVQPSGGLVRGFMRLGTYAGSHDCGEG